MNRWKRQIPEGVQDYLPRECYNKTLVEDKLRNFFYLSGYDGIETPLFEFFDVFMDDNAPIPQEEMFKVVDVGNRILVIRPDFTMPIARVASIKMKDAPLPLRLSYSSSVYRHEKSHRGNQREIAQAGIELIGANGPEADGEVIATAIAGLLQLGLENFKIDIGQVDYFKGLIDNADFEPGQIESLRQLIEDKNILGLEKFLDNTSIDTSLKNSFLELPSLYGGIEILDRSYKSSLNDRSKKAIENIKEVYEIIDDYGFKDYISFDLGMVHSLDYYTGIIFRGFSHGLGFPICGGGRYDELLGKFGRPMPATGFAMGIKRLLIALEYQDSLKTIPPIDVLIVHEKGQGRKAYELAQCIRKSGKRVEIFLGSEDCPKEYAKKKNIAKITYISGEGETDDNYGFA